MLIQHGAYNYIESEGDSPSYNVKTPDTIYKMDYAATGRSLFYSFEDKELESCFLTDDEYLYGIYKILSKEATPEGSNVYESEKCAIFRLNLSTAELSDVYVFEPKEYYANEQIHGVFDNQIIFGTRIETPITSDNFQDVEHAYQLYAVQPKTGIAKQLWRKVDSNGFTISPVENDMIYFLASSAFDGAQPDVYQLNLSTMEPTLFFTDEGRYKWGNDFFDNHAYVATLVFTMDQFNELPEIDKPRWIDLSTGEANEALFSIVTSSDGYSYTTTVFPLAIFGEYYLVQYTSEHTDTGTLYIPALITKADFWAGIPNYIPITLVE
ncbi:MAG: hypothetical protein ACK5JF_11535 [Oscillospiraceae bacterium]